MEEGEVQAMKELAAAMNRLAAAIEPFTKSASASLGGYLSPISVRCECNCDRHRNPMYGYGDNTPRY